MLHKFETAVAREFIVSALGLVGKANEQAVRDNFTAYLPRFFPVSPSPWWVEYHVKGTEGHLRFAKGSAIAHGFVDNLVGLTAIEYEKDLGDPALLAHGKDQVADYCAGLINSGGEHGQIIGILSDTLRWRAFKVATVSRPEGATCGRDHVTLESIDELDIASSDDRSAAKLGEFLERHLGRIGARPLGAETLAGDLGLESPFCARHTGGIRAAVDAAFAASPKYASLIKGLWSNFVAYLGSSENGATSAFDVGAYQDELYVLTLAKLLCANVLAKQALTSADDEVRSILAGDFFKSKGLVNLVEYDYFGWLNEDPYVGALIPIARAIQGDLVAYDFKSPPAEDLFGATMAQLARRSHRILLGQEWTPAWLSAKIVEKTISAIPAGEDPRLVDMCCGSGSMVVEAVKLAKARLDAGLAPGATRGQEYVRRLSQAITGFDIDPLAVMLAKVGWVIAARDRLEPFGSFQVSIPVYHADSLFAATPISKHIDAQTGGKSYELVLHDRKVELPAYLVTPEFGPLFDALLEGGYDLAIESAKLPAAKYKPADLVRLLDGAQAGTGLTLSATAADEALGFLVELAAAIEALQRAGTNGIWAFVLRNSYRPALVTGMFNGLVSNPPWLAMSKIADNPYKEALRARASRYQIRPAGSSHLHIEMATIFLIHATDRYLRPGAAIGCVLPESVLSGHHHNPFRLGKFRAGGAPVPICVDVLWRVEAGTFKNEAIVLFGGKRPRAPFHPTPIPGLVAGRSGLSPRTFNVVTQGNRVAWSDNPGAHSSAGFFNPAEFRQGADIMPRRLVFHNAVQQPGGNWAIGPIDRASGPLRYLVTDEKKFTDFSVRQTVIDDRFMFDVLISKHLAAFHLAEPAKAMLPIEKGQPSGWVAVNRSSIIASGAATAAAFRQVFKELGPAVGPDEFFSALDSDRHKLTTQEIPTTGWLVFLGAGGERVCAAYAKASRFTAGKLVVDQTLYWASVGSQDEAIYLTGLLNSEAINQVIQEFQPRGQFGRRHVHKLPLGVTPPFEPGRPDHADVVVKTKALQCQLATAMVAVGMKKFLDPNATLASRRRKITECIRSLPDYQGFEQACRAVYAI
jgi:hypothetical protein